MVRYIYTRQTGKTHTSGGRTVTYQIYKMSQNKPHHIGEHKANTANYRGDGTEVRSFIAKKEGYAFDGFRFKRSDIEIEEL